MSILIKGISMPKNCYDCELIDIVKVCPHYEIPNEAFVSIPWLRKRRHENCPLIELPPHGDLIDRDKLLEQFAKEQKAADEHGRDFSFSFYSGNEVCTEWWAVEKFVDDAPTIIESEEGKDNAD